MTAEALNVAELAGRRVILRGQFVGVVTVEAVEELAPGLNLLRVRTEAGQLDEATLADDALETGDVVVVDAPELVDGEDFFSVIEAHRIDLAYAHDPNFAVSLSGVRGLPHQIVAVYRHMLPQARLRFVLADDPGAGKTIMTGLLVKELRLRSVADRILVLCPAPLTLQWQEELEDKFDERFEIIDSRVRWASSSNPWQRHDRCISSIDFAKRDEVRPDLLLAEWDLVVIDEAHKCAATTRHDHREDRDRIDATKRYQLAEALSGKTERLVLATATPHAGDRDRFQNFLRLLDPDQFSVGDLASEQIARTDSPYFLRRIKEELKDEQGHDLFVPREVLSQPFSLTTPEEQLYVAVTEYIQEFLGAAAGRRGTAVALARTVLQRRLASSLGAIRSSLRKRADRIADRIAEVEALPPEERARRLAELRVLNEVDAEQDLEDATESTEDTAVAEVVVAETLDGMRAEVRRLERLLVQADETIEVGEEAKLTALRECLARSELAELRENGRGKLLIFTEHRDTLDYLVEHVSAWGYSTCFIHGGMAPAERREIQQRFHAERQICVATEAAGEGINLQFCHLMINYDLPWNPVRLEQRMGRIHRIGQERKCVIFNFVAQNTIEGKLLQRLLDKLDTMRVDLGPRVYDVVGEVLAHNGLDFERLLRDALLNPHIVEQSLDEISAIDADALKEYERDIGIAQATRHIDMTWVRERDWRSDERRLMPEFVDRFFRRASQRLNLRLEERADGLLRMEHVPRLLTSDELESVRRLGRPRQTYRKLTFDKDIRRQAQHEDAVLLSPGHPLFAATKERLLQELRGVEGAVAPFVAPWAADPYAIHFFTHRVTGLGTDGQPEDVFAELVAVSESADGLEMLPPDVLHDLTPSAFAPQGIDAPDADIVRRATNFVRVELQQDVVRRRREERLRQAELRSRYLREAMDLQISRQQERWALLDERVYHGDDAARLARDEADRRIRELEQRRDRKLGSLEQLGVVRAGPVQYLGTALVGPSPVHDDPVVQVMRNDREVELAAMDVAMEYERDHGWEPEDVSAARDGSGFDIRSVRRGADGREEVQRIEVKGRGPSHGDVGMCRTEWIAAHRHRESYWLYVVYGAGSPKPRLVRVQNPAARLADAVREARHVTTYYLPGAAIEGAA